MGQFGKYHNTLCLSPKFCISIVFSFSLVPRENESSAYAELGEQTKSVMVFSQNGL